MDSPTELTLVPDLSYEPAFSLATEESEVLINGARVIVDRKVALVPVSVETEKEKNGKN